MQLVADNLWTYIVDKDSPAIIEEATSYFQDGAWFTPRFKKGHWDGRVRLTKFDRERGLYRFPTGLLPAVVELLNKKNWRFSVDESGRTWDEFEPIHQLFDNKAGIITIRDYQQNAVEAACMHGRGIFKIATGGGKTVIGSGLVQTVRRRTMWQVHRCNLMYQTQAVLQERLRIPIGICGDSKCDLQEVMVCMVPSTYNAITTDCNPEFRDWLGGVYLWINDECHHLRDEKGGDTLAQQLTIAEFITAPMRIGMSATPHLEGPGIATMAMLGQILVNIPASYLIENGYLIRPYIWLVKNDELIPFTKEDKLPQKYKRGIVQNAARTRKTVDVLERWRYEQRKPLVLTDQIAHAGNIIEEAQRSKLRYRFINGKVSELDRRKYIDDLYNSEVDYLIAISETMGEGTDVPFLDAMFNATGASDGSKSKYGDSGKRTKQMLGRILRPFEGKTRCDYVDVIDSCDKDLLKQSAGRIQTLESEGYGPYMGYWDKYVGVS